LSKRKIAIVGGSGYVGSAIAAYLSETENIIVVDKNPIAAVIANKVEYRACDILNYEEVRSKLKDVDLVVHTAIIQIPTINEKIRLGYAVNFQGVQNVCRIVDEIPSIKGMLLTGTWHVFGERKLNGTLDESFGFRPDKVEGRARLYVMSKIAQEVIVRYYDEMSNKIYGVIRMGTVLGKGMPEKTAANIFISKGLDGEPLTPFKQSMYRPMLYVDISDVCEAYARFADKILRDQAPKEETSLAHVVNLCYPEPITIIDLANITRDAIIEQTRGKLQPRVEIVDNGQQVLFEPEDKLKIKVDISRLAGFLGIDRLKDPATSIKELVRDAIAARESDGT
jgi:nucleoside-diphosphate-sugar epimerase